MANKNTATKNTATKNITTTQKKKEENTMKYANIKKADLITIIEERDKMIQTLNAKVKADEEIIEAVKNVTRQFVAGMNDIFAPTAVGKDTAKAAPAAKTVTKTANTTKTATVAKTATGTKKNTDKKPEEKKWLTKEEYKAQFTEAQTKEWAEKKARERQIKNEVAAEMREEAKKNGYWKKAEYKKEFDKRVAARLEVK